MATTSIILTFLILTTSSSVSAKEKPAKQSPEKTYFAMGHLGLGIAPHNNAGLGVGYRIDDTLLMLGLSASGVRTRTLGNGPSLQGLFKVKKDTVITAGLFGYFGEGVRNVAFSEKCQECYEAGGPDVPYHVSSLQSSYRFLYINAGGGFMHDINEHAKILFQAGWAYCIYAKVKTNETPNPDYGEANGVLIDYSSYLKKSQSIVKKDDHGPYVQLSVLLPLY